MEQKAIRVSTTKILPHMLECHFYGHLKKAFGCCPEQHKPKIVRWGRGRDLNSGERLHRPLCYQATPPRPLFHAKLAPRLLLPSFMLGFVRDIANTLFSFAEDFSAIIVLSSYVFKTYLDQLASLLCIESYACYELVVWQCLE